MYIKMDKLINFFIEEPEKEFYVRELARILKKSPTTISSKLKEYSKLGILNYEKKLNHLLFKANTESRKFKQIKLNYNLSNISESGLVEYLTEEFNYPKAIVLFGSFSKAENIKKSDIDVLIITALRKELDLSKYEKKLGHKIQLFIHSDKEIVSMQKTNKELINSWVNGIVIYGNLEVFK